MCLMVVFLNRRKTAAILLQIKLIIKNETDIFIQKISPPNQNWYGGLDCFTRLIPPQKHRYWFVARVFQAAFVLFRLPEFRLECVFSRSNID